MLKGPSELCFFTHHGSRITHAKRSAARKTVSPRHTTNNPKATRKPLRTRVRRSLAVPQSMKSRNFHGETVNHIPARTQAYAQTVITRRQDVSTQRADSTIS